MGYNIQNTIEALENKLELYYYVNMEGVQKSRTTQCTPHCIAIRTAKLQKARKEREQIIAKEQENVASTILTGESEWDKRGKRGGHQPCRAPQGGALHSGGSTSSLPINSLLPDKVR